MGYEGVGAGVACEGPSQLMVSRALARSACAWGSLLDGMGSCVLSQPCLVQ